MNIEFLQSSSQARQVEGKNPSIQGIIIKKSKTLQQQQNQAQKLKDEKPLMIKCVKKSGKNLSRTRRRQVPNSLMDPLSTEANTDDLKLSNCSESIDQNNTLFIEESTNDKIRNATKNSLYKYTPNGSSESIGQKNNQLFKEVNISDIELSDSAGW